MIRVPGWRAVGGMCHRSEFLNNAPFARVYRSVEENEMKRNLAASKNRLAPPSSKPSFALYEMNY